MASTKRKGKVFDAFLVASARTGDRQALAHLVADWNGRFLAHAWRLVGDRETARDVVQEAWLDIVRNLSRLDDAGAFPAWAYRIVSRRSARAIGGLERKRRLNAAIVAEPPPASIEAETTPDADRLRAAIRQLPPDQRAAIALFHLEEMSIAEVAVALDVPAGTVKTRLMHARRKLRAALEGDT